MEPVVVVDDVSRRYGETVALDDISFRLGAGEVFALVGPNGAGKTTLVRAITGTTVCNGTVELFGASPTAIDEARIGLLPQAFDPASGLTPRELIGYYGGLYDEARAPGPVLEDVGLTDAAEQPYETLSGGQQRRTCLGTALVNEPDLLVLDEPTTGIDPAGRRTIWKRLSALASGGTTILLTTHYMAEAEHLADRVGLLADGQLVALDTPAALVATYGGESLLRIEGDFADVPEGLEYPASVRDGRLTVTGVPPETIGQVVATLEAAGLAYESLSWTEPDLADVYLEVTGRTVTESGESLSSEEVGLA